MCSNLACSACIYLQFGVLYITKFIGVEDITKYLAFQSKMLAKKPQ
jgi:hypothetical protein